MKTGTNMSNAIERIKGYCTEVTQAQWEELVRVADEVGVPVFRRKFPDVKTMFISVHSMDMDIIKDSCNYYNYPQIPFPDFLAKLRGEEWTPKAGEMVEVSRNGEVWMSREFVTKSKGRFIVWSNADEAVDFPLCRPITPAITRAEAEQQLGKRIID